MTRKTTVCFLSGREPGFHRNRSILRALDSLGYRLIVCSSSSGTYPTRYWSSLVSYLRSPKFDLLFLGFLGHPYALFAKRLSPRKTILDALLSPYDTICLDRRYFSPNSLPGKYLKKFEATAYQNVDRILFDTQTHVSYIRKEFSLPRGKLAHLYVGADESVFYPGPESTSGDDCKILWYGTFLPLHGVGTVMDAIDLLSNEKRLSFTIVGKGMESRKFVKWLKKSDDRRITYIPWLPLRKLGELTREADIFLGGHFSKTAKASRVVPAKAFEGAAAGRAMIVGDNSANREVFRPNVDAAFVEMANGVVLAETISDLAAKPSLRRKYGSRAREAYLRSASSAVVASNLEAVISQVMDE